MLGCYVRINGHKRGTGYSYSVREFELYTTGTGTPLPTPSGPTSPGITKVIGTPGNWQLSVDGAPYVVKGLTWGPPVSEAARMPDVRAMGVNTVRTWGTDGASQALFDAAASNGIKVIAGFWL